MANKSILIKPVAAAVGVAFVSSLVFSVTAVADDNPFDATDLDAGYMLADGHEKGEEGSCGEGEGSCGEGEGSCGEGEGSCGEGEGSLKAKALAVKAKALAVKAKALAVKAKALAVRKVKTANVVKANAVAKANRKL